MVPNRYKYELEQFCKSKLREPKKGVLRQQRAFSFILEQNWQAVAQQLLQKRLLKMADEIR